MRTSCRRLLAWKVRSPSLPLLLAVVAAASIPVMGLVNLCMPPLASAAVIHVPIDYPTISDALGSLQFAWGDTILVAPGTYYESLEIPFGVTLLGSGGPQVTVLHHDTRAITCEQPLLGVPFILVGFTIRDATDTALSCGLHDQGDIEIRDCRFVGNTGLEGGAMTIAFMGSSTGSIHVSDCIFEDNTALDWGAGIAIGGDGITGIIENNRFTRNAALKGAAIGTRAINREESPPPLVIRDNAFIENQATAEGGAVVIIGGRLLEISGNLFSDNSAGTHGGAMALLGGDASITVRDNIVLRSVAGQIGGGLALLNSGSSAEQNTIDGCSGLRGGGIAVYQPMGVALFNNLVTNSGIGSGIRYEGPGGGFATGCNDSWGNAGEDFEGFLPSSDDLSLDPQYCAPEVEDYALRATSPCAPPQAPPGCGLIGALPVGCGITSVPEAGAPTTQFLTVAPNPAWGRLQFYPVSPMSMVLNIIDSQGRIVHRIKPINGHWEWLPGQSVPTGVYFALPEGGGQQPAPVKFVYLR